MLCCGQLEVVQLLVESGANVNHRDHLGVTALFWATGDIFKMCAHFCEKFHLHDKRNSGNYCSILVSALLAYSAAFICKAIWKL